MAYGAGDAEGPRGAKRIAYVIEGGKITHAYEVKNAAEHASQVLDDLRAG